MCNFSNSLVSALSVSPGSFKDKFQLLPCGFGGRPLDGFIMTICDDLSSVLSILSAWSRFADVFGISYVLMSVDGGETFKHYSLFKRETSQEGLQEGSSNYIDSLI